MHSINRLEVLRQMLMKNVSYVSKQNKLSYFPKYEIKLN
jgi:hypothetical protein